MPTMFEDDNKKQVSVLTEMNYLLNDQVMMATIPRSRAFETCADTYSTVFDLTVSDFEGGKKTLAVAQDAVQKSALELERVEISDEIARMRAEARERHGWIMDTYLLRRG